MKKLYVIVFITLLLLTGCNSKTQKEETVTQSQNVSELMVVNKEETAKEKINTETSIKETDKTSDSSDTVNSKSESVSSVNNGTKIKKGHYENVLVKEAYDETVLVKAAYDEKIITKDGFSEQVLVKEAWTETVKGDCAIYSQDIIGNFKCTKCGAIFMTSPEAGEHLDTHPAEEGFASYNNTTTYAGEYHCTSWFPDETVNHPAEYKTTYHDPEYKTVHHEAEYKTVHHDAKYEQRWVED